MSFGAYTNSAITSSTNVIVNCTNGTTYTISFNDTPPSTPGSPKYLLANTTSGLESNTLEITFKNAANQTMTNGAATITGTGTGSAVTLSGAITGTIAAGQLSGKPAGTYSTTMTLNIVY
jgi:spore coat protein U-like protein